MPSLVRYIAQTIGGIRQYSGFQSSLVHLWGDPNSKMAGLEGVLLGMGKLWFLTCWRPRSRISVFWCLISNIYTSLVDIERIIDD